MMDEHPQYVVVNYSESDADGKPSYVFVHSQEELFCVIDTAHRLNTLIAIYRLGACLLDWS